MSSKTRTFQGSPFSFRIADCGTSPFGVASCDKLAGSATSLFKLRTLSIACICRSRRDCILRAIERTNGGRGRLDGSGVAAIKKKDSARVMHARRLAYVGSSWRRGHAGLGGSGKSCPSDWEFPQLFWHQKPSLSPSPGALGAVSGEVPWKATLNLQPRQTENHNIQLLPFNHTVHPS
jgi:hypothetical protein